MLICTTAQDNLDNAIECANATLIVAAVNFMRNSTVPFSGGQSSVKPTYQDICDGFNRTIESLRSELEAAKAKAEWVDRWPDVLQPILSQFPAATEALTELRTLIEKGK